MWRGLDNVTYVVVQGLPLTRQEGTGTLPPTEQLASLSPVLNLSCDHQTKIYKGDSGTNED